MADLAVVGGGFLPSFKGRGSGFTWTLLRLVESGWRVRARVFHWIAGDQAPFIRREILLAHGGYPMVRLAEDWAFAARLRSLGPLAVIDQSVEVSPRRHVANGVLKTLVVTGSIEAMYRAGVSTGFLARWYRYWLPRERG